MNTRELLIQAAYITASVLFILGLRSLTKADTARRGMQQAALGMLIAVVGTLLHHEIVSFGWILAGLVIGSIIGYPLGVYVPMTAMPQRIAISHVFGALAATLVGIAEYYTHVRDGLPLPAPLMAALGFEVVFGALTGRDPRSLGDTECSAFELGLSRAQAGVLQQVAFDELAKTGLKPNPRVTEARARPERCASH